MDCLCCRRRHDGKCAKYRHTVNLQAIPFIALLSCIVARPECMEVCCEIVAVSGWKGKSCNLILSALLFENKVILHPYKIIIRWIFKRYNMKCNNIEKMLYCTINTRKNVILHNKWMKYTIKIVYNVQCFWHPCTAAQCTFHTLII